MKNKLEFDKQFDKLEFDKLEFDGLVFQRT